MIRSLVLLLLIVTVLVGAAAYRDRPLIVLNGRFLTMDSTDSVVRALGIHSETIHAAGDVGDVTRTMEQLVSTFDWWNRLWGLRIVDLQGQTVLPGFVDAHSHFPANGIASVGLDLSSPPFGQVSDIPALLKEIGKKAEEQPERRWIIGFDYDDAALLEQRHPTRRELDKAAPEHAVYLRHRSGHMGVANSRALAQLGFLGSDVSGAANVVVKSGLDAYVGRDSDGRLNGLLQEGAAPAMHRLIREIPWWKLPPILFRARNEYLRAGVTTVQNGYADKNSLQLLRFAVKTRLLAQRVLLWPADEKLQQRPDSAAPHGVDHDSAARDYEDLARLIGWPTDERRHVAIGAIKIIADGSPQGRTAWLSAPYLFDERLGKGYRGHASVPDLRLHASIVSYHKAGYQLALHGNGDAAIQSLINGLDIAQRLHPRADARHIIVHAQTISQTQLDRLAELDVSVSFFPAHTYYWGEWYRSRVLGDQRAAFISPLASADAAGVRYTIHADSPVTPMNPMQMVWSATERLTSNDYLLGSDQRVSRTRALRALTIDAAWQNHLDHDRGSLEVGKLADFLVLSDDPLGVNDVRKVSVEQVWIGGKRRYP